MTDVPTSYPSLSPGTASQASASRMASSEKLPTASGVHMACSLPSRTISLSPTFDAIFRESGKVVPIRFERPDKRSRIGWTNARKPAKTWSGAPAKATSGVPPSRPIAVVSPGRMAIRCAINALESVRASAVASRRPAPVPPTRRSKSQTSPARAAAIEAASRCAVSIAAIVAFEVITHSATRRVENVSWFTEATSINARAGCVRESGSPCFAIDQQVRGADYPASRTGGHVRSCLPHPAHALAGSSLADGKNDWAAAIPIQIGLQHTVRSVGMTSPTSTRTGPSKAPEVSRADAPRGRVNNTPAINCRNVCNGSAGKVAGIAAANDQAPGQRLPPGSDRHQTTEKRRKAATSRLVRALVGGCTVIIAR